MTSAFRPKVWISRPDGSTLCQASNPVGVFELVCEVDRPGVHSIWVTDRDLNQAGAYELSLNRLNAPAVSSPIAYGGTVTGARDSAAKAAAWVFTGAVNDQVYLRMTSAFRPKVWISRPDGSTLCQASNPVGVFELVCEVDRPGVHSIWVTDRDLNQAGAYELSLNRLKVSGVQRVEHDHLGGWRAALRK